MLPIPPHSYFLLSHNQMMHQHQLLARQWQHIHSPPPQTTLEHMRACADRILNPCTKDTVKNRQAHYKASCFFVSENREAYPFTPEDKERAWMLAAKGVKRYFPWAFVHLGHCYQQGLGSAKSAILALDQYFLGAQYNNAEAYYNIALIYMKNPESIKNPIEPESIKNPIQEAMRFYRLAAQLGHQEAQYQLGRYYENGDNGVPLNWQEMLYYYGMAAAKGHVEAQYHLGLIYDPHTTALEGIKKDLKKAIYCYELAVENGGHEEAKKALKAIHDHRCFHNDEEKKEL